MDNLEWYSTKAPRYKELESKVKGIIEEMLTSEVILFDVIQSRVKTLEGFEEKISWKGYTHPGQVKRLTRDLNNLLGSTWCKKYLGCN
jgi:hypothetical protein